MKKLITAALIIATLAIPTIARGSGRGPCSEDRLDVKHHMTRTRQIHRTDALITCAAARFPVPGGASKARTVADCESHDYPWADNGHGDLGVFQVSAWSSRARTYLKRRWFPFHWVPRWQHARANVLTAIVWVHRARSWSAWSCA